MVRIADVLQGGQYGPVTSTGIDDGSPIRWGLVDPATVPEVVEPLNGVPDRAQVAPEIGHVSIVTPRAPRLAPADQRATRVWSGHTAV